MKKQAGFPMVFDALRPLLCKHADHLNVITDNASHYYLDTAHTMKNGNPLFFGAVKVNKNYVSFHLMPVYVQPSLLDAISDILRRRMQGKSCFNFTQVDTELFKELDTLTSAGHEYYVSEGYIDFAS